tara:strand:- start:232 stop:528 length:297 start_codon:yes stop_codon:yes gene_type:complete
MKIKAYLKPSCGWSKGIRAIMDKYDLAYEDLDVINNPANYEEMVKKTNQTFQPCIEIDDTMLVDVSGEELEAYLIDKKLVGQNDKEVSVSINSSCSSH